MLLTIVRGRGGYIARREEMGGIFVLLAGIRWKNTDERKYSHERIFKCFNRLGLAYR